MLTDRLPRKKTLRAKFLESDQLTRIEVPPDDRLRASSAIIEAAMKQESRPAIQKACADFLAIASNFYGVSCPDVRALAVRPLRVREGGWASELFGDYTLQTASIRVWTRTPIRKQATSFGTFLSTLCHEFCHHLDCKRFGFGQSPHTRGFYSRTAVLYHHARSTELKPLVWLRLPGGRWRIDWRRMRPPSAEQISSRNGTVSQC